MPKGDFPMPEPSLPQPKKLLDQLRDAIRIQHYSYSSEKAYLHWARRYILFHDEINPPGRFPKCRRRIPSAAVLSALA
jgi:hypothetical protein